MEFTLPRLYYSLLLVLSLAPLAARASEDAAVHWTPTALSSDQYESTPTFSPDGNEIFFMRSDPAFATYRLMRSRCVNGNWSKPESPSFASARPAFDADPFLTVDGKRLYFISTREQTNPEDFDIWYSDRNSDGSWSAAHRLPEPVNSKGSELLPRAMTDGRLYFGSDRAGGLGQGDIYIATPQDDGKWQVRNLGAPINTSAFEYEADISRDERTMIVVADRGDRSHLYRFTNAAGEWREEGRIPARPDVFQVGPLLSPTGDRLLFAQNTADRSGEIFLIDLSPRSQASWPPTCTKK